jgi:hypothetical protein
MDERQEAPTSMLVPTRPIRGGGMALRWPVPCHSLWCEKLSCLLGGLGIRGRELGVGDVGTF